MFERSLYRAPHEKQGRGRTRTGAAVMVMGQQQTTHLPYVSRKSVVLTWSTGLVPPEQLVQAERPEE